MRSARLVQGGSTLVLALVCFLSVGCGPTHIRSMSPKNRTYNQGRYAQTETKPAEGSLFNPASVGFLQDTRANRIGDIVVIKIDEQADAKGDASTKLGKSTKREAGMDALLGLVPALKRTNPDLDMSKLLALASTTSFQGDGTTSRKGQLSGSIAVRVKDRMPNGDLYIEGTKVVMINNEECHIYVSGLIRSADVTQDNTVASSKIADAQVEFTGRGDVAEQTERGWLTKLLDTINPF